MIRAGHSKVAMDSVKIQYRWARRYFKDIEEVVDKLEINKTSRNWWAEPISFWDGVSDTNIHNNPPTLYNQV